MALLMLKAPPVPSESRSGSINLKGCHFMLFSRKHTVSGAVDQGASVTASMGKT